jgi:hypothetical protein
MAMPLVKQPAPALFVLCFAAYAYFYQGGGWNQNVRFDLVRSTVEQGTAVIDAYHRNTGDLACRGPSGRCRKPRPARGEHAYADKAPGASWLAVPAYAAVHAYTGGERPSPGYLNTAAYVCTMWAVALPSALAVVALYALLGALGLGVGAASAFALAYGLGTLAFPYATLFYGHQLAAALLLMGFAALVCIRHEHGRGHGRGQGQGQGTAGGAPARTRLLGTGVLLGAAVAVEYPAALAVLPICLYAAAFVRPLPRLGWLILGMAGPGVALAAYHAMVFGSPLALPYDFSTQPHRSQGFFMGLGVPRWEALRHILFTSYRGLFYSAPWLLLALPGAAIMARRPGLRAEVAVCASVTLLFVWLNASLVDWQGGWAMGARYLIPAIPFLVVLAAGAALLGAGRGVRIVAWLGLAALVVYSAFHMLVGAAVKPEVPVHIARPFAQFLLARFYRGELAVNAQSIDAIAPSPAGQRFAWNLGELAGLRGLSSLVPLALVATACLGWLVWAVRRQRAADALTAGYR